MATERDPADPSDDYYRRDFEQAEEWHNKRLTDRITSTEVCKLLEDRFEPMSEDHCNDDEDNMERDFARAKEVYQNQEY